MNEWNVIEEQVKRSKIKRYPWKEILKKSLTSVILENKIKGYTKEQTLNYILNSEEMKALEQDLMIYNPAEFERMKEKLKISICARYGENKTALKIYQKLKNESTN